MKHGGSVESEDLGVITPRSQSGLINYLLDDLGVPTLNPTFTIVNDVGGADDIERIDELSPISQALSNFI